MVTDPSSDFVNSIKNKILSEKSKINSERDMFNSIFDYIHSAFNEFLNSKIESRKIDTDTTSFGTLKFEYLMDCKTIEFIFSNNSIKFNKFSVTDVKASYLLRVNENIAFSGKKVNIMCIFSNNTIRLEIAKKSNSHIILDDNEKNLGVSIFSGNSIYYYTLDKKTFTKNSINKIATPDNLFMLSLMILNDNETEINKITKIRNPLKKQYELE